ncbi:hypothetical protein AAFC00_003654 [Neodothiora populina]|uniref:Fibroin-3 n=1 Tax=Neodothiora populina TaxID=2781224 RepID=A0ABR3PG44_9PEZI
MPTLLWQRDITSDVDSVKTTFSGWDQCMTKAYCKWPAIIAIIAGCVIALSIVWCLVRCICCGAECCCGCLSCCACCADCCNSGRRRNQGYAQPAPQAYQYQSAPPPMYAAPQYAQFDTSYGSKGAAGTKYNEDALPVMPSWENSRTARSPLPDNDVEMDRLNHLNNHPAAPMIPPSARYNDGDLGTMGGPHYQDTSYNHTMPSLSYNDPYAGYSGAQAPHLQQETGYSRPGAYAAPPSYRSTPPSAVAPAVGRKPVENSWRDV